jgi:copper(I)-binding protein
MERSRVIKLAALYGVVVLLLAWLLLPVISFAEASLTISNGWTRPTLKGQMMGAAYVTLTNETKTPIDVMAASAKIAERVELHTHLHEDGVARMRQITELQIMPESTQQMKPGGLHIMFFGLRQPLKEGESFPLTLTLADGTQLSTTIAVKQPE